MLSPARMPAYVNALARLDWARFDVAALRQLGARLGLEGFEDDGVVLATCGGFLEDGWLAAGYTVGRFTDLLALVHLSEDADAEELDRAWDLAHLATGQILGAPRLQRATYALWDGPTSTLALYRGLRDAEFGSEVAWMAVPRGQPLPLEFLTTS